MNKQNFKTGSVKLLTAVIWTAWLCISAGAEVGVLNDYAAEKNIESIYKSYHEDILDFQYAYIWRLYNKARETNDGTITGLLANMVLLNPDENMEQFKEVIDFCDSKKKLNEEQTVELIKHTERKYAAKLLEAWYEYTMEIIKKNYSTAIEKANNLIDVDKMELEHINQTASTCQICKEHRTDQIFATKCEISIIKAIIAKKNGKPVQFNPEISDYFWKHPDLFMYTKIKRYLTLLIVYNKKEEFEKVFDNYPLESLRFFFRCKQRAEVYYDWFNQHEYWLTPEFKEVIEKIKPVMLSKIKDCGFVKKK